MHFLPLDMEGSPQKEDAELFSSRQRIRKWKSLAGVGHLLTLSSAVLSILWFIPKVDWRDAKIAGQEIQERLESRQMLLEALDKLARYQKYFNELNGRYTRDLSRLPLPRQLSLGSLEQLKRQYEFSVIEARPNRFLLLATGLNHSDRVTIDESLRINANFVLPPPSKAYLSQEANRILRLKNSGKSADDGAFSRYWKIISVDENQWAVLGQRSPVLGERRELEATRGVASLFSSVSAQLKQHIGDATFKTMGNSFQENMDPQEVADWLQSARLAQHIYKREIGHYARRWEDLDTVSDYKFFERMKSVKNIRVNPIEIEAGDSGFRIVMEGTSGDLLGEQFVMDISGSIRQVRYTDALVQQLQQTTHILDNLRFQINPVVEGSGSRAQP